MIHNLDKFKSLIVMLSAINVFAVSTFSYDNIKEYSNTSHTFYESSKQISKEFNSNTINAKSKEAVVLTEEAVVLTEEAVVLTEEAVVLTEEAVVLSIEENAIKIAEENAPFDINEIKVDYIDEDSEKLTVIDVYLDLPSDTNYKELFDLSSKVTNMFEEEFLITYM